MPGAFGWDDHGCAGQTLPIALGLSDSYLKQLRKTLFFALFALAGPFARERRGAPTAPGTPAGCGPGAGWLRMLLGAFLTFHPWVKGQERSESHGVVALYTPSARACGALASGGGFVQASGGNPRLELTRYLPQGQL